MRLPGDKSISHRALFFGGLNQGSTTLRGLAPGEDVRSTMKVLKRLGVTSTTVQSGVQLQRSSIRAHLGDLYCGNSGTTARLLAGYLAGEEGTYRITGDTSLSSRPMERIVQPLQRMGIDITSMNGLLPITVNSHGSARAVATGPAAWRDSADRIVLDAASAQVHAGIVLAAIRSNTRIAVRRTAPMRDHTLRTACLFGLDISADSESGFPVDIIAADVIDRDVDFEIPGDVSSAAFWVVAALLVPRSQLRLRSVGLNPTRTTFLGALRAMGADLSWTPDDGIEPSGTIDVAGGPRLNGLDFSGNGGPFPIGLMIDELPLLALVAARARGRTVVRGATELRNKESDRVAGLVSLMRNLGVVIEEFNDGFALDGPQRIEGGVVDPRGDHRLAMLAGIASLISNGPVDVLDSNVAAVSYPSFWSELERLTGRAIPRNDAAPV